MMCLFLEQEDFVTFLHFEVTFSLFITRTCDMLVVSKSRLRFELFVPFLILSVYVE